MTFVPSLPPVDCDKCNRQIRLVTVWGNPDRSLEVEVRCHGKVDRCIIPREMLHDPTLKFVGRGKAFTTKERA